MSSNILLLTKLENQQIVTGKTRFQLDEQIRKSILILEKEWSEKDIAFELDELEKTEYEFNEEMLSHLWINLISNAIKFTCNGGTITISAKQRGGFITVSVKDDGIGMSEETKSRIFEKFYQADTSHSGKGNGIGLNIAHRIATLARGEIQVESKLGKGSEFIVRLPI
jgi:signal transduction histidine kinase